MKMKIAFISEHASPLATLGGVDAGGQNVYVAELSKYLSQEGFEVDIFTRWEDAGQPKIVSWLPDVRVIHIKAGAVKVIPKEELLHHMPEFRDEMVSFINQEGIDYKLIHAHFFMSAWVACELKAQLSIPFVVTFHALGIIRRMHQKGKDSFPAERLQIEKNAIAQADQVIAECPQDREDLIRYYMADPKKITVIPCGFCPDNFHPVNKTLARQIIGIHSDERIILQLGRMVPRKGVDNVIESLAILRNNNIKIRLLIVGGESDLPDPVICPEIGRLQQLAVAKGVEGSITFTGRKNRNLLKFYYAAADIFITTPWYEPFGITPLESMACGTPVIGANVGGIKFSVVDGKTGFLVPPNDPQALSEKIATLLADEALLNSMRINSLLRVNTFFTWEKIAEMTTDVYEQIVEEVPSKKVISLWNHSPKPVINMEGKIPMGKEAGL